MNAGRQLHGLMAEFRRPEELLDAVRRAREAGYRLFEAYTPQPVEGLSDAMGFRHSALSAIVLAGGLVGALGGYFLQAYSMAIDYPLNVGGRPLHSWPAFIPITFEMAVLAGGVSAVLGLFALCGLPCPYHPVFNVPRFALASRDRFFLCIEARDRRFDRAGTADFLKTLRPEEVYEVPD